MLGWHHGLLLQKEGQLCRCKLCRRTTGQGPQNVQSSGKACTGRSPDGLQTSHAFIRRVQRHPSPRLKSGSLTKRETDEGNVASYPRKPGGEVTDFWVRSWWVWVWRRPWPGGQDGATEGINSQVGRGLRGLEH